MSRERRENPRTPVTVETTLYYNSLTLMGCRLSDISLTGACIDPGSMGDQVLPKNADIDMALSINADGEIHYHRIPAKVARIDKDGIGIAFQFSGYDDFCNMVELVKLANC